MTKLIDSDQAGEISNDETGYVIGDGDNGTVSGDGGTALTADVADNPSNNDIKVDVQAPGAQGDTVDTGANNYDWKKTEMAYKQSTFSSYEGPVTAYFGDCHTPNDYFFKIFDSDIQENILFQTNLYVTQKQNGKTIPAINKEELFGFLGIN